MPDPTITPVCDGWDVTTVVGVLHYTREPSSAEVASMVAALLAEPPEAPVVPTDSRDALIESLTVERDALLGERDLLVSERDVLVSEKQVLIGALAEAEIALPVDVKPSPVDIIKPGRLV